MAESVPVSVVIPFYDGHATIDRALRSVDAQRARPAEIIVVDDGSEAAPSLVSEVPVRRVTFKENRGIPAARNAGIRAAGQPWLAFLDQDDEWERDRLSRQWELAAAVDPGSVTIIFGRLESRGQGPPVITPPLGAIRGMEAGGDAAVRELMRTGNVVPWITTLVPRAAFEELGYLDERLRGGGDDYEFVLRAAVDGVSFRCVDREPGRFSAVHHFTGRNYSAAVGWLEDSIAALETHAARSPVIAGDLGAARARVRYWAGRYLDRAGHRKAAARKYVAALAETPLLLEAYAALALLALPTRARRFVHWLLRRRR